MKEVKNKIGHSDFAMLAVAMVYFENIQKCKDGYGKKGNPKDGFVNGLKWVYPKFRSHKNGNALAELVYRECRCGMYHVGLIGTQIILDCSISSGIAIRKGEIIICSSKVVEDIQRHFNQYISDLKNKSNSILRANFEKRLKYIWGV